MYDVFDAMTRLTGAELVAQACAARAGEPTPGVTIEAMKRQAQQIKNEMRSRGEPAKHGHCLEAVARAHGYRTYASARAALAAREDSATPARG